MINFNGELQQNNKVSIAVSNRGFTYGDALFETVRVNAKHVLFWEDHYFRLMASMRILRMKIPMNFTLEYLEKQILDTVSSHGITNNQSVRAKLVVFRDSEGLYTPSQNTIGFVISIAKIESPYYSLKKEKYTIELFKDHFIAADLLSTLKTNNRIINVLASIYAKENSFNNLLLLNTEKKVVEAINGNLFLINDNIIKTPSLKEGCINGVLRKQIIELFKKNTEFTVVETSITAFELLKAEELFITNVISGVVSISNYRKKIFNSVKTERIVALLNAKIRLI